jgi:hypothetical protein
MGNSRNPFLITGGVLSAIAALLHLGCIAFGAPWYRFFGAGEQMAQMHLAGDRYPTFVTLFIATALLVWSFYAFSGAGVLRKLPLTRWVLCGITGVYMVRGVCFAPLISFFPDNSITFWVVSSAICLVFGVVHLIGLRQVWSRL